MTPQFILCRPILCDRQEVCDPHIGDKCSDLADVFVAGGIVVVQRVGKELHQAFPHCRGSAGGRTGCMEIGACHGVGE